MTFTAPGSGASGVFSNSTTSITVATNASGVASDFVHGERYGRRTLYGDGVSNGLDRGEFLADQYAGLAEHNDGKCRGHAAVRGDRLGIWHCAGSDRQRCGEQSNIGRECDVHGAWLRSERRVQQFNDVDYGSHQCVWSGVSTLHGECNRRRTLHSDCGGLGSGDGELLADQHVVQLHSDPDRASLYRGRRIEYGNRHRGQWLCLDGDHRCAEWITLQSGGVSGNGSGSFVYSVVTNPALARFRGTITVGNSSFVVMEGGSTSDVPFTDVTPSFPYFDYVSLMSSNGITVGCQTTPAMYCPTEDVTRAEMAVFIVKGIDVALNATLTYPTTSYFGDVPATGVVDSEYFDFVQRIAQLGITVGCQTTPAMYCPDETITQGEMAVFVIRAWMYITTGNASGTFSLRERLCSTTFLHRTNTLRTYKRWGSWDSGRAVAAEHTARALQ